MCLLALLTLIPTLATGITLRGQKSICIPSPSTARGVFFVFRIRTGLISEIRTPDAYYRHEERHQRPPAAWCAVPFPADRNESHKSRCQIVVARPSAIPSAPSVVSSRSRLVPSLSRPSVSFCLRHSARSRSIHLSFSHELMLRQTLVARSASLSSASLSAPISPSARLTFFDRRRNARSLASRLESAAPPYSTLLSLSLFPLRSLSYSLSLSLSLPLTRFPACLAIFVPLLAVSPLVLFIFFFFFLSFSVSRSPSIRTPWRDDSIPWRGVGNGGGDCRDGGRLCQ